jgi:hypothetical protein
VAPGSRRNPEPPASSIWRRLADRAVLRSQYALPSALPELRLLAAEAAAVGWGPVMLR